MEKVLCREPDLGQTAGNVKLVSTVILGESIFKFSCEQTDTQTDKQKDRETQTNTKEYNCDNKSSPL